MKRARELVLLLLSRLIGRGVVFFFILSVLLVSLYLLGNFQEFLDTSQLFLLRILEVALLLEVLFSLLEIGLLLLRSALREPFRALRFCLTFLSLTFCFVLLLGLKFLAAWFQL